MIHYRSARERLSYRRIFEDLRLQGYAGSYDNVRRYAHDWAERQGVASAEAYVPLIFAPGEAYQFDWSHECAEIINALARRQQPQPPPPIMTPERLTLSTPPVADCGRYDSLRGAGDTASRSRPPARSEGTYGAL